MQKAIAGLILLTFIFSSLGLTDFAYAEFDFADVGNGSYIMPESPYQIPSDGPEPEWLPVADAVVIPDAIRIPPPDDPVVPDEDEVENGDEARLLSIDRGGLMAFAPEESLGEPPYESPSAAVLSYVPGQLIVKFTDETSRRIDARLSASNLSFSPQEDVSAVTRLSIDGLNSPYSITSISPLFPDLKRRQLQTGLSYLALAEETDWYPERKPAGALVPNLTNIYVLELSGSPDIEEIAREYKKDRNVEYAEPNYLITALAEPNDTFFSNQWALNNTGQEARSGPKYNFVVWGTPGADIKWLADWQTRQTQLNNGPIIGIIDTGVDYTHPELRDKVIAGYDFANEDTEPMDDNGHGSAVAAIAAAKTNNGIGIAGVCPNCMIMPVKLLNSFGAGSTSNTAKTIEYAVNRGAAVLNNSWAGRNHSDLAKDAVDYAYSKGVVIVAAAGNSGNVVSNPILYPAAYDHVIAVGATDNNDRNAYFSSHGDWVDLSAPGVGVIVPFKDEYVWWGGTSMSAPHVSGLAGLILSENPALNPDQVERILKSSADDLGSPGWDEYYGAGKINVQKALQQLAPQPTPAPTPVPAFTPTPIPTPTPQINKIYLPDVRKGESLSRR